jgi:predicted RNA binding protein YcfA (HicA-like mRNA interferase family)
MMKVRELRAELRSAGCEVRQRRGSHQTWSHPRQPGNVVLAGNDGDEAQKYQVAGVRRFLRGTMVYQ